MHCVCMIEFVYAISCGNNNFKPEYNAKVNECELNATEKKNI